MKFRITLRDNIIVEVDRKEEWMEEKLADRDIDWLHFLKEKVIIQKSHIIHLQII